MSGADRLEDGFPHGTVAGYAAGCQGGYCPAGNEHGLSCKRAKQLTAGDYRFQRLVKQGLSPSELALEMGLTPETHEAPRARKVIDPDGREEEDPIDDEEEEVVEETKVAPTPKDVAHKFEVFKKPTAPRPEPTADDEKRRRAEIRAWAHEHGINIGAKGRIPQAVVIGWLNEDPTLGGTIKPKRKRLGKMKPTAQPPALSEPVEHELAAVTTAVDATYPANDGSRVDTDPTHGRIDKDIQEQVDEMSPTTLGQRVALEVTLQEQRDREAASSEVPILSPEQQDAVITAIVHAPVVPDMETRAQLYNEGYADAEEHYAAAIDDMLRAESALALVLQKWAAEQQKRKDAERLIFVLATQVKELEESLEQRGPSLQKGDLVHVVMYGSAPGMTPRGAHVAARKPWWKRGVA